MTKSTGIGRGGKRKGAGRKRQVSTVRKIEKAVETAAETIAIAIREPSADLTAAGLLAKAYSTLQDVMDNSPFPAPRVTAARAIIDLARLEQAEKAGVGAGTGKKEQQAAAADRVASGGRFAAPPPPKLVVNNP